MKYKGIIFDLDGTLIDSIDDLADSVNRALKRLGYPTHEREAYRFFIGDGMKTLTWRVLPEESRSSDLVEECYLAAKEEYHKGWAVKTQLFPGIAQLLDNLTQLGIPLTILSNKPHEYTLPVVERFLAKWNFQIVWGARAEVPIKPHPAGAISIVNQLDARPEQIIYLGDSGVDMETAVRAGVLPIGVLWGFRPKEELLQYGAKILLEEPNQLMQIVI